MFRKSPTILVVALCAIALPGLSACGQKGDLVLPPGKSLVIRADAPAPSPVVTQGMDTALPAWPGAPAASNAISPGTPTPARQP